MAYAQHAAGTGMSFYVSIGLYWEYLFVCVSFVEIFFIDKITDMI